MLKSLKSRLLILLVFIALPGFLSILFNAQQARQSTIDSNKQYAIEVARRLAVTQQQLIQTTRSYLQYLATTEPLQNPSSPKCSAFLSQILQLNSSFVNIGVPLTNGDLLCNALPLTKKVNVFDRAYFQQSLQHKQFAIGTYQHDRAAQKTSVNFSYPVISKKNKEIAGIAVAVVSLDWWSQQLQAYQLPEDSIALITDTKGFIVANHPDDITKQGASPQHYDFTIDTNKVYELETELITDSLGVTRIFTHQTLYTKENGKSVTVSVGISLNAPLTAAHKQFIFSLLSFSAFMLVMTLLAYKGLNVSIISPLRKLTEAATKLAEGHFSTVKLPYGAKELSILNTQFEVMANARLSAERTIKKHHEELNSIFNALPDIYFRLSKSGIILDYRAASPSSLYTEPKNFLGKNMHEVIPQSTSKIFQEKLDKINSNQPLSAWEYPLDINNEPKIFEARALPILDSDEIVIVIRDITEHKHAEELMQTAALVYQNSSECMAVTDLDGYIISINPAFTSVTGYSEEEVLGSRTSMLSSGRHDQAFYESMWKTINDTGHWEGEIFNRRKNGEIFPEWLSINTIYNDENRPIRRVALYRDITEQKQANKLIWQQAHFDSVTGLPNRNMLADRIKQAIKHADRNNLTVALLFIDLDKFKEVNDTLGHDTGDLLLTEVAKRLLNCTRSGDTVARQGGDEFTILLGELNDYTPAERVSNIILEQMSQPFVLKDDTIYITPSIGIAFYPQDASNTDDLLKAADQAMYAAKELGRNRFHYFTQSMQEAAIHRMELVQDLRKAQTNEEFELYYQPIVSLATGELHKAEALIRWNHPEKGIVCPADFIPTAEETRQIISIGYWVFNEACVSIKELRDVFGEDFQLSINVSPVQFSSQSHSISQWLPDLAAKNIDGNAIVAEITEGILMNANDENLQQLIEFRNAGIQVSLDDFGTGYSSLAYILEYDIDYLKIDQTFVKSLQPNSDAFILCEAIIMMAHRLGIKVIAEGIETEQQKELLLIANCDYGQGYLFSKPVPLTTFTELEKNFSH